MMKSRAQKPIRKLRPWMVTLALMSVQQAYGAPPQVTPAQFDITGPIEDFKLQSACIPPSIFEHPENYSMNADYMALNCMAWITVNGQTVVLPSNTVITYPASFLTPYETFAYNPTGKSDESGLAVKDQDRLPQVKYPYQPNNVKPATYQASLQGNLIWNSNDPMCIGLNPCYIAGLVHISQDSLNASQGFINYIDYGTGELYVGGTEGQKNGTRIRINDPVGRYGRKTGPRGDGYGDTQDIRFAVDDGNPTIHAETGYPMCIPRFDPKTGLGGTDDPLCPEKNRRAGGTGPVQTAFTMAPVAPVINPIAVVGLPPVLAGSDPREQAPFEIGDYIDYAGTLAWDDKGTFLSAHTITANLGIYTTPGTDPAYMTQEVTILGVGIPGAFGAPAEGTDRFKIVGFSTDTARIVDVSMVDVDPCTGNEGSRTVTSLFPNGSPFDPTAAANVPLGRFRSQIVKGLALLPATKEIRTEIRGSNPPDPITGIRLTAAHGLEYGQYTAPVSEYIFAENLGFGGLPIIPNNFEDFSFLALGHGPWTLYDPYGVVFVPPNFVNGPPSPIQGQLNPWPGTPAPLGANCGPNGAPPVIVVNDITAMTLSTVTLNASASFSPAQPAANPLSFSWEQTSGPNVMPFNNQTQTIIQGSTLTFVAPSTKAPLQLTFALTVKDSNGRIANKPVTVTVNPMPLSDIVSIPAATLPTYRTRDGAWNVTANTTDVNATLSITAYSGINGTGNVVLTTRAMTRVSSGVGNWIFSQKLPVSPTPASIKVTSSKGGSATANMSIITK